MDPLVQTVEVITKFLLCVLLTQFGKTFTAIGRISDEIKRDATEGFSIHLVWTMNTLLSNAQFSNRLNSIEEEYGKGSVVVFASKNTGHRYKHIHNLIELQGICLDVHTCPRVVVMCSNDVRFNDGFKFANILQGNTTNIIRVFAYYDELHNYITDKLRNQIEELDNLDIVKGIIALTATPDKILLKTGYWSMIRMIMLSDFNEKDYAGSADMTFNHVNDYFPAEYRRPGPFDFDALDKDTVGFVKHVLDANPHILENGSRTFIPAHKRRVGHKLVRKEVFDRSPNAVVVVLNGEEKTLQYHDETTKTISLLSATEEVCETIARVIQTNSLEGRPLVITGFLCVGLGQTLIHKKLGTFTSAILSHLDLTNDDIYQLFGRLTARSKLWGDKFVSTNVYCPEIVMNRVIAMEECARNLAKQHNGEMVTEADYRAPLAQLGRIGEAAIGNIRVKKEKKVKIAKPSPIEHNVAFVTLKEVEAFLTEKYKKPIHPRSFVTRGKEPNKDDKDGYVISTRLLAYNGKTKDYLTQEDRLTFEFYKNIKIGMNISRTEGSGQPYMVYPVYPTKDSLPTELKYYVRYMEPTTSVVAA